MGEKKVNSCDYCLRLCGSKGNILQVDGFEVWLYRKI